MDRDIIKLVVVILGTVSVVSIVGMVVLVSFGREPPSALVAISASSIGSLAGILASQKGERQ